MINLDLIPSPRSDKWKNIFAAFTVGIFLVLIGSSILHNITPPDPFFGVDSAPYNPKTIPIATFIFMIFRAVILAPLVEEGFWRYFVISLIRYRSDYNHLRLPFVIGGSLLFGYWHGGETNILVQGLFGFCLYWVYIKNGFSYWSSVLVHAAYNALLIGGVISFPNF